MTEQQLEAITLAANEAVTEATRVLENELGTVVSDEEREQMVGEVFGIVERLVLGRLLG